ncbi:D-glycero-alpha-D-manno-heptose-1,7-bisphosphate 7-phosphatase [Rugosimonospora africana]|uniref:D-glycero-alpha-D-manno-heptose-1,7-bisphosphate 7-phosphatase n=1 Tax=Rugosimonospora africana TaxID=556532 RepID=UPI0019428067
MARESESGPRDDPSRDDPPPGSGRRFGAALFDRDGTLIENVPYNADPRLVRPIPGAREALDRLRGAGLKLGVVTNQSAIRRGLATAEQVEAVNRRVEELLGPFDTWQVCPHGPHDGCACRKPAPGMVLDAAAALGVATPECVVVGDNGTDLAAAAAAGASGVLVPAPMTRAGEGTGVAVAGVAVAGVAVAGVAVAGAERVGAAVAGVIPAAVVPAAVVAADLAGAVDWILGTASGAAALGAPTASGAATASDAATASGAAAASGAGAGPAAEREVRRLLQG